MPACLRETFFDGNKTTDEVLAVRALPVLKRRYAVLREFGIDRLHDRYVDRDSPDALNDLWRSPARCDQRQDTEQ